MKDITITSKQIKKELITFLFCFILAFLSNIGAIIWYKTSAIEILTSLTYVFVFSVFIYFVWGFLRIIKYALYKFKS